jgi:putative membrane protein
VLAPVTGLVATLGLATPLGSTLARLMFLVVLANGDHLIDPSANTVHEVSLSAMCRTIEVISCKRLQTSLPKRLEPDAMVCFWPLASFPQLKTNKTEKPLP